jgi:4-amino-4-deoxy-L-arabinose transferase-like glycosyltransferase
MHYVSLIVEFLRGRPAWVFWIAALGQATLWFLIPSLFYSAPPGELSGILAIGHEFRLGSDLGPPLAFWLAELAFRIAGIVGVYFLSQLCVVVAFWAVFSLGRSIVGTRHAVLAILFMTGIAAFNVPSPEFGPAILALPFWALSLLYYWRAAGVGRRGDWFSFGFCMGFLLLSSYMGAILLLLLIVYTAANPRGWSEFRHPEPWLAVLLIIFVVLPHIGWIEWMPSSALAALGVEPSGAHITPSAALWLIVSVLVAHLGVAVLAVLASGWPRRRRELAPIIERLPVELYGRVFIYVFAIAPAAIAAAAALVIGRGGPLDRVGPLVLLTGLAVVTAAGDQMPLYRERIVSFAWLGLLALPPLGAALAIAVVPLLGGDLKVAQPANSMGRYFAEAFQRRTGRPLAYVAGDQRLAELVAIGAPTRPHVFFTSAPEKSPWAKPDDVRAAGGVLVWLSTDNAGTPPAALKAAFPDLVAEVPRVYARSVQGFLPLIRVGWAVIRPPNAQPAR